MSMDIAKFCDSYQKGADLQSENRRVIATASYTRETVATITMSFVVALPPPLDGNTSLVVFVDKLTKMIHIAPCVGLSTAPALADLFIKNVFRYHGMPTRFVSDRDPRFNSDFWKEFATGRPIAAPSI